MRAREREREEKGTTKKRDWRQRALLQQQNLYFLFYLSWFGKQASKQAQYNEGCAKLNYLLPEVL